MGNLPPGLKERGSLKREMLELAKILRQLILTATS